jgi:hypothetical protein
MMPIRKLARIEDAARPLGPPLEGANLKDAFWLSAFCFRLRPWTVPRGVYRNASIEEAQARRRAWEAGSDR